MKSKGSKYHPPRISGRQKLQRQRDHEEYMKKRKNAKFVILDTDGNDWSSRNHQ